MFQRLNLPYFNDKQAHVTLDDFKVAVFVCALTNKQFKDLIDESPYELLSWQNIKTLGYARYYTKKHSVLSYQVRRWSNELEKSIKKSKTFNLVYEISKFNSYLATIKNEPNILPTDNASSSKGSEAPWALSLKDVLMNKYKDESVVLDMPIAQAFWEFYKYAETQGSAEFFDLEDLEAQGLITKI